MNKRFNLFNTNLNRAVVDPWYTDDFETCYSDIMIGIEALINKLEL